MDWSTMLLRLGAAVAAGGLVGLEREIFGKAAGFRTNILICLGAAVMSMIGVAMSQELTVAQRVMADPQRIGAGIIAGIGFLGAGAIIQARGSVRGLTTAATIWVVAAIGLAIGVGYLGLAGLTTLLTVATLYGLEKVERLITGRYATVEYALVAEPDGAVLEEVQRCAEKAKGDLFGLHVEKGPRELLLHFSVRATPAAQRRLARALLGVGGVRSMERR